MAMVDDYCRASINLDKSHAAAQWNTNPGLSQTQRDAYLEQEVEDFRKLRNRYPHRYIATRMPPKIEGGMTLYQVKMVFGDGSQMDCISVPLPTLEAWKNDGEDVEIRDLK